MLISSGLSSSEIIYAPNSIEANEGQYVKGTYRHYTNMSEPYEDLEIILDVAYSIEKEVTLSDISDKLIQISEFFNVTSITDPYVYNIHTEWKESYLVWKETREIVIPLVEYDYFNGSVHYYASMFDYTTFADMCSLDNLVIFFDNGTSRLWSQIDVESYTLENSYDFCHFLSYISGAWELSTLFPERTMYVISPQAQVGQTVDFGWYNGTILDENSVVIGSESYSAKHCYFPQWEIHYNDDPMNWGIGLFEHDIYYHSDTGLILQFNYSDTYLKGSFIPYEFFIPKNNTYTLPVETFVILIGIISVGISYYLRKRKQQNI